MMKVEKKAICAVCPFCNRTPIVDFDMETGNIDTLYYSGKCSLGFASSSEPCSIKSMLDVVIPIAHLIHATYKSIYNNLLETAAELFNTHNNDDAGFLIEYDETFVRECEARGGHEARRKS